MKKEYVKTLLLGCAVLVLGATLCWNILSYSRVMAANADREEAVKVDVGKELMLVAGNQGSRLVVVDPDTETFGCYAMNGRKLRLYNTRKYSQDFHFQDLADTPLENSRQVSVKDVEKYIPRYDLQMKKYEEREKRRNKEK